MAYGSGFFLGEEYVDRVALTDKLVVNAQSIGVADFSFGFDGYDGILGLGPTALTRSTVNNTDTVPTVVDQLFAHGKIPKRLLGVSFAPLGVNSGAGSLSFGHPDSSKYVGHVSYTPVTTASPSSLFFGVDACASYNGTDVLSSAAGIVDTGTTLILLASDAFAAYALATGAVLDPGVGLLRVTKQQYAALKPLVFRIGGRSLRLAPNAQIFPRSLDVLIGGDADAIYLVVADLGTVSGAGLDFVLGQSFLCVRRAQRVACADASCMTGSASTPCTTAATRRTGARVGSGSRTRGTHSR